jgi:hypothetical protein
VYVALDERRGGEARCGARDDESSDDDGGAA